MMSVLNQPQPGNLVVDASTGRIIPVGGGFSGNLGPVGVNFGLGYEPGFGLGVGGDLGYGPQYSTYGANPTYVQYYKPYLNQQPEVVYTDSVVGTPVQLGRTIQERQPVYRYRHTRPYYVRRGGYYNNNVYVYPRTTAYYNY